MTLNNYASQVIGSNKEYVRNPVNISNFANMQNTSAEPDKNRFDTLAHALNVIHKGGDAEVRNGNVLLGTISNLYGVFPYSDLNGDYLYGLVEDGANSKVVDIDLTDGSTTDVVGSLLGQGTPTAVSMNGWLYVANGIYLYKYQSSATSLKLSGEDTKFITSDGTRVWAVQSTTTEDLLRFSTKSVIGDITTLDDGGGTAVLSRSGVADTTIAKFTALNASGDWVIGCGKNKTEIYRIPNFSVNGVTTFNQDLPIRVYTIDNIGVETNTALTTHEGYAYLKGTDGYLYRIHLASGKVKQFGGNLLQMEGLDFSQAALTIDKEKNLLLIACKSGETNDRVVCFNIVEENFSIFDNMFVSGFAKVGNSVYYEGRGGKVYECLKSGVYLDEGNSIHIKTRTQSADMGTQDFYKVLKELFLGVEYNENLTLTINVYKDRAVNGKFNSDYTKQLSIEVNDNDNLETYAEAFGLGVWGASGVDTGSYLSEKVFTTERVGLYGVRFEIEVETYVKSKFSVRGLGFNYEMTPKRNYNLVYN